MKTVPFWPTINNIHKIITKNPIIRGYRVFFGTKKTIVTLSHMYSADKDKKSPKEKTACKTKHNKIIAGRTGLTIQQHQYDKAINSVRPLP